MLLIKSQPFLLLSAFFLISSTLFSLSYGASQFSHRPTKNIQGMMNQAFEAIKVEDVQNYSLILAANKTHRIDPLNSFEYYTGGWDIKNENYLASVAFTGVLYFALAVAWFFIMSTFLFCACIRCCCCHKKRKYGYSRTCYALSLIFLLLFTVAAVVGCAILYTGQGHFHGSVKATLDYIIDQAVTIFDNLKDILNILIGAKGVVVDNMFLPPGLQKNIDSINTLINATSKIPEMTSFNISSSIHSVLDPAGQALSIFAAVMLVIAFLGFLFSLLGMKSLVYIFVVLSWILVTITLILCGIFLIFHNVVADTCVAMEEWVENPTAHTALSNILPCVDSEDAKQILDTSRAVSSQLVNLSNNYITHVANNDLLPKAGPFYHNQSGPLVPVLCNPYDAKLNDRSCTPGEVQLSNVTEEWKHYVCQAGAAGICITEGRMTPEIYDQITAAANITNALDHYTPFLVDLVDCTTVRKTFTDIIGNHCPGLRRYSKWIYTGMLTVSVAVMLSLIFWLVYVRERRLRINTKKVMATPEDPLVGRRGL